MISLMLCVLLYAPIGAYKFDNIDHIYSSRFDNCSQHEEQSMACIHSAGVCLTRTDTLERIPFCLCINGFDGPRCELSALPHLPVITQCNEFPWMLCTIICSIIICIFLLVTLCSHYKIRNAFAPVSLSA